MRDLGSTLHTQVSNGPTRLLLTDKEKHTGYNRHICAPSVKPRYTQTHTAQVRDQCVTATKCVAGTATVHVTT